MHRANTQPLAATLGGVQITVVEVSDKPKHKPSAKHTLEEVRKSLEDLVRNQLDEAPAAASTEEQTATETEAEMSFASNPPRHGRGRRHGPGLDTQSLLRSLKGLIGDELGEGAEPPIQVATTQEAAPGSRAPTAPASADVEHRPEPPATPLAAATPETPPESLPDSEEITLEAADPGDTLGEDLMEAADLDSDLPWSTRARTAQPANRHPEKNPEGRASDQYGGARSTPVGDTTGHAKGPAAPIKIVDLLRADGSATAFAARDPALSPLPMDGDTMRRSEGLAASEPELWTYAVVTAPWPTDHTREPSHDQPSPLETPAAKSLAEDAEELILEALPEPQASEVSLEERPSLEEEPSLGSGLSSTPDEAPSVNEAISPETKDGPADDLVLAEELTLDVETSPQGRHRDSRLQEKEAVASSRLDLLEIPGDETALEPIEPGIEDGSHKGSPPIVAAPPKAEDTDLEVAPDKEMSTPPVAAPETHDEEDIDLGAPLGAQLMPEMPEIPHHRKPSESPPKAAMSDKQAEQTRLEQKKPEPPKAERSSAAPAPPPAKERPRKPARPRSFVAPSDPAGIFGKLPQPEFRSGGAQPPSADRKEAPPKRKHPKQKPSLSAADAKAKPPASAPFSLSLFEEPPKALSRGSGVADVPSTSAKKADSVPAPKARSAGDFAKAPPIPKMVTPPAPSAPAPRAEKRPVRPKPGAAQPWPGSKLPRPLKPAKVDAPDKGLTAVPVLKAVVNERSTSRALQKVAPTKDTARARTPERDTMLKRPPTAATASGGDTDPRALAVQIIARLNMELRKCGERALNPTIINRLQYLLRDALALRATRAKNERDKR